VVWPARRVDNWLGTIDALRPGIGRWRERKASRTLESAAGRKHNRTGMTMAGVMTSTWLAAVVAGLVLAAGIACPAGAQQAQPVPGAAPKSTTAKQAPKGTSQPKQPDGAGESTAGSRTEAQLRQRIEHLEEQLVDLQVVIGTLESLARSAGTSSSSIAFRAGGSGVGLASSDAARIDGIETQIRALTAQVEQLTEQVRAGRGQTAPVTAAPRPPTAVAPAVSFGTTTVTSGGTGDQIGRVLNEDPAQQPQRQAGIAPPPAASDPAGAKQLYETAYGYLLQQNYGAAEASFDDFLQRYPSDPLAGNAQYWLGESHFVRGNYKAAASAFLKGYQTYAKSAKAPDSLLKLAMSLDRLGQKEAACSSFNELSARFPQAPAHVKGRADSERRRLGCT
jgi:tol-pal system protein YbgF